MIFDNNMAYQTYRVLVSIFGTLGMIISLTPMKKNHKRNLLILGGYVVYAVVYSSLSLRFLGFLSFCGVPSLPFLCPVCLPFT